MTLSQTAYWNMLAARVAAGNITQQQAETLFEEMKRKQLTA